MRVSLDWIKDYVKIDATPEAIAEKLTMIGLEVEAVERIDDDVVFEVNVTPNRADCLSVIGIARELSVSYGLPLVFPDLKIVAETAPLDFNIEIAQPELCRRYAGRIVHNLKVGPSPDWMKKRLEKCGIRSINNVVDVTNYVLLEFGQPLHAFDLGTLKGGMIRVGTPQAITGESSMKFKTLDGTERDIPGDSLMIWDGERPVAIAGVMGGLNTEVTESTRDILIESACFEPTSVRRTSKALGLKSDASYRFERGTDIKALKKALERAALLTRELAGGSICGKIDIYPRQFHPAEINVRFDRVNKLLGLNLSPGTILNCLKGLGLDITEQQGSGFIAKIPPYRMDITMEADIIEEVARFYGYDKIPAELPEAIIGGTGLRDNVYATGIKRDIRQSFLKSGFTEAINLSFMGSNDLDLLSIPQDDARRRLVKIMNPLREEEAFMRTTILPSLLRNLTHNISHGNRDLRFFEISRVFEDSGSGPLPDEKERIAAIYFREKSGSLYKEEAADFYILKGVVEAMLSSIGAGDLSYVRSEEPFLHPGRSADVLIGGQKVGYIGALSPEVTDRLDIKAHKPSIIALEMDMASIISASKKNITFKHLPKYPFVERDTAIILDANIEAAAIIGHLKSYPSEMIEDITIFDVYQGKGIEEGKKSVAFNVRYRSREKTLTDAEVEKLHSSLVEYIKEKTAGQVRG
jgi:phenylalanyl-tRNA synthetase beta chain